MAGETPPPTSTGSNLPTSPKSKSPSPEKSPPHHADSGETSALAEILPAQHWVVAAEENGADNIDDASTIASSTASLTTSILEYRRIHGRTFHHEIGNASYWASNDTQQNESMDIYHHVQTLVIGGKLFLSPLDTEKIQKVLDIGTGNGSWAIDFADEYPNVEVIGTDVSPIQSAWVPPNLKFDDGSVKENSAQDQWGKIYTNFGKSIGRSFTIIPDGVQRAAMEAAGFVDIHEIDYKTPIGTWPKDPHLKEIGQFTQLTIETDIEGYILYPATAIGWTPEEVTVFAACVRREIRNPDIHSYYRQKVVYGRKPVVEG
ncbi:related to methyltransferase [Cephalotrichum gorgonifer]|uniref:Related to methyltransferase n=1 Tax=Cephalotrichum gorgonifer TaxID=2041049 RepID=A0AAE8MWM3_9PEZI|nr:related to methyltransferase [Cephalotrichum gorgonifer]